MQAVLFADRNGVDLGALSERVCPALMPIADRPVVQYAIEDMAAAGIDEIFLVLSRDADRVSDVVGGGELWGVTIHRVLTRGEEAVDEVVTRFGNRLRLPFVAARADVFRAPMCSTFLDRALELNGSIVLAGCGGSHAYLGLVRSRNASLATLDWRSGENARPDVEVGPKLFSALDSVAELHRTALAVLTEGRRTRLTPLGRSLVAGLTLNRGARVNARSHAGGPVFAGEHAFIDPTATVTGPCVVGAYCYVDAGAHLESAVLLPGTYVGKGLEVRDAVVAGRHLVRVDCNIAMRVTDPLLLDESSPALCEWLVELPWRCASAVLLAASAPLWPVAWACALASSRGDVLERHAVLANRWEERPPGRHRKVARGWRFKTAIPVLRNLPLLWLCVTGELRLFGAEPLRNDEACSGKPWDQRHERLDAGLLGPAVLTVAADAPEEEVRLNELVFVRERGIRAALTRWRLAVRALLSSRAWAAPA